MLKPESIGSVVLKFIENFGEKENSSGKRTSNQSQKKSSRSVQVIGDHNIVNNVSVENKIEQEEKTKRIVDEKKKQSKNELKIEKENKSYPIPLADVDVTKFGIDNPLLEKIYNEALNEANKIYNDSQLNSFSIRVIPFDEVTKFCIMFGFYSKWANKTCKFTFHQGNKKIEHYPPNRTVKYEPDKEVFSSMPWIESPHWTLNSSAKPMTR